MNEGTIALVVAVESVLADTDRATLAQTIGPTHLRLLEQALADARPAPTARRPERRSGATDPRMHYSLAELRNGTGFEPGAAFVQDRRMVNKT